MKKAILNKHFVQSGKSTVANASVKELIKKLDLVIDISTYFLNNQCQNSGDKVLH